MVTSDANKSLKISDAISLINQEVSLVGVVVECREIRHSRGPDWLRSLRIIDDSLQTGLTVNFFTSTVEQLPHVKNLDDMILLTRVKIKAFAGDKVSAVFNKRVSSFALYEEGDDDDFVCYQCSSSFVDRAQYKNSIDNLGKWLACSKGRKGPDNFSFLREIKEGKCLNLACQILHVNEDRSVIFVWDGTDVPPASVLVTRKEEDAFSSLPLCTFLSRDHLVELPTIGSILRVSAYNRFSSLIKCSQWVKLCGLFCRVEGGIWIGECIDSTKVKLLRDDRLVHNINRLYNKRKSSKLGCIPYWSFPRPPGLTVTDHDFAPFVTLMDILKFQEVTSKFRCVVRVVAAYPWRVDNFYSKKRGCFRVLLTLEDPTAILKAFLCDEEAEKFWGGYHGVEMLMKKRNRLLGIHELENGIDDWRATRNPPWIECCILSYYTDKSDPWKTRFYRIFNTRLVV